MFGQYGHAPSHLGKFCTGIRFSPDSSQLYVCDSAGDGNDQYRISVFTADGGFVRTGGEGVLTGASDLAFADDSSLLISNFRSMKDPHFAVLSPGTMAEVRRFPGALGALRADEQLNVPVSIAMHGGYAYVLDYSAPHVMVWE